MKTLNTTSATVGVLFLIAAVASIIGVILYAPILNDTEYILSDASSNSRISWGAIFEIITAFAVAGTSITLFPILKEYSESLALACVGFRVLEAAVIIVGILPLLTIVTINHQLPTDVQNDGSTYLIIGRALVAFHNWTFLYGPNVLLGPSTLMTSYILYKSKLVPRFISVLGLIGGPMIFVCGLLVTLGLFDQVSSWGAVLAIPVFVYEMSLAIRLMTRGFEMNSNTSVLKQDLFRLSSEKIA